MADAFDQDRADFSGVTPGRDLRMSKVIHQASDVRSGACLFVARQGAVIGASTASPQHSPAVRNQGGSLFGLACPAD